jgi:hypothetical protein
MLPKAFSLKVTDDGIGPSSLAVSTSASAKWYSDRRDPAHNNFDRAVSFRITITQSPEREHTEEEISK